MHTRERGSGSVHSTARPPTEPGRTEISGSTVVGDLPLPAHRHPGRQRRAADHTIFGAILQLGLPAVESPKYVVAFRGTLCDDPTRYRDLLLDLKCFFNTLHRSSRFRHALRSIERTVDIAGSHNVWLAGHSLGSAIALLAGKHMARSGHNLPTYLFNSPFTSAPLERVNHQKIKQGIHIASSVMKAGLSAALKHQHNLKDDDCDENGDWFEALRGWEPQLFVNPRDHICSGYIGYFEQREKMNRIGISKLERVAAQHTVKSLVCAALDRQSEPFHLLPSAKLVINEGDASRFREAHGIKQWCHPDLHCHSLVYRYN